MFFGVPNSRRKPAEHFKKIQLDIVPLSNEILISEIVVLLLLLLSPILTSPQALSSIDRHQAGKSRRILFGV